MSWLLDMRPRGAGGGSVPVAPVDATYITQTPNATLTNEQALSLLATGLLKNTTGTGVLSIGVPTVDFASAAQGALAGTALQPADVGGAAYAEIADFATAAQGALADTAVQPADLATVATSGAYGDLTGLPTLGTLAAFNDAPSNGSQYARLDGAWAVVSGGVTSVFTRTGAVVAASGDYTAAQVTNAAAVNAANVFTAAQTIRLNSTAGFAIQDASSQNTVVVDTTNGVTSFKYPGGANEGGIVVKKNSANVGGYSLMEIAGTNSSVWTTNKGLVFRNQTAEIFVGCSMNFSTGIAIDFLWAGASAVNTPEDLMLISASAQQVRLTAMKYASSPYPDVIMSAPSFSVQTKTGAAWSDGNGGAIYGTQRFKVQADGNVAFGSHTATAIIHAIQTDAVTATVTNVSILGHNSSGTPAAGFGVGLAFQGESSTTDNQDMARFAAIWDVATHASRSAALRILISGSGGEVDAAKFDDDATAGNTRMLLYDVDNGQLERVSVGIADSGGIGFKVLRIAN